MGSWGTGISSNDVYEDINQEFFELYNQGMDVQAITEKLVKENKELIESREDQNNFWISIAKFQWECKALDPVILKQIKDIVETEKDLELWEELNASKSDITKRRKVLEAFLEKLSTEKKTARKRKVMKLNDAIFQKGDCLVFKLSDGEYCGAFVLESEKETEFGLNLIAVTDIKKSDKPKIQDFENANVLFESRQLGKTYLEPKEKVSWYYAQFFKKAETKFEVVGQLDVDKKYNSSKDFLGFSNWDNLSMFQDSYYADFENNKCDMSIPLIILRKSKGYSNGNIPWLQRIKTKFK
ncbi:hypothetical protein [Yeosuana marina]|uniref:hypothetical protein n=1 Tax=Yeosuana marina TaxID=1565536 RepID=UPI0030C8A551